MSDRFDQTARQSQILIVDDRTENVDIQHQILKAKGYSVAAVPSGVVALEVLPKLDPDLVLLDVMMPDMDGFEVCRRIRKLDKFSDIPVIFVTALGQADAVAKGFAAGGTDYISKPIRQEEVWARVDAHLKAKHLSEEREKLIAKLSALERKNRAIIEKASDPMLTLRPPGIIESANPTALKLLKFNRDELVGQSLENILEPPYASHYQSILSHSNGGNESISDKANEVIVKRRDGSTLVADMILTELGLDSPLFLCTIHDLSLHQKMLKELRRISHIDKLTNLANRRRFDDVYAMELARAKRTSQPLSLLFIDIDYFKNYNDRYGHPKGDQTLQQVAHVLAETVARPSDLIARYGGEEFVAILPDTSLEGASAVAENIRQRIASLRIEHQDSGQNGFITVSIGVATKLIDMDTGDNELIIAADRALYEAKAKGRNRVCLA
jgi:diguanylate cyclase (GGDEF)-like protein/PAS domain S-box-containing protein